MKLWPGWENECKPANPERWDAGVYTYGKPENSSRAYFKYKSDCAGCHEPFLAQVKRIEGEYIFGAYCTNDCRVKWHKISEETRQKMSYASSHTSEETRLKIGRANTGKKRSVETCARISAVKLGVPRPLDSIIRSTQNHMNPDREAVASAIVFNRYRNNAASLGRDFLLPREEVHRLITCACYYCGSPPSSPTEIQQDAKVYVREKEVFLFGGIDRIDSSLGYTPTNVVPACSKCNIAKMARSAPDFIAWILRINAFIVSGPPKLIYFGDIPPQQTRYAKEVYHKYNGGNKARRSIDCSIPFDIFCVFIRTQCAYCGAGLMNACGGRCGRKRDRIDETRIFHYNGLDRVDASGIYEVSNVIPCCRDCNLAKNTMSYSEFYTWVMRAAHHIQATPALLSLVPASV
jgi:hypothetical protein